MNHQPCRAYLQNSTHMSLALSEARIAFETSNIHLENLILAELADDTGSVKPIVASLQDSIGKLGGFIDRIGLLRNQMRRQNYRDLPSLEKMDIHSLGIQLQKRQLVSTDAWEKIQSLMTGHDSFYKVLNHFETVAKQLIVDTEALLNKFIALEKCAESGEVNFVLEENRDGNIKIEFATLYNRWSVFQQEFLASSLLSTQLWYAHTGVGWIVPGAGIRAA